MVKMLDESAVRFRPTVAVIDLDAVRHNVRALTPPGVEVMAVVKANGYGHGALPVARAALETGATWLGVATVEEGIEVRDAGISAPVLVLSEPPPGSEHQVLAQGLTPTLYSDGGLRRLVNAAARSGPAIGVHVKVDTGMHRVGLSPEATQPFVRRLVDAGVRLDGLWTHLAVSEDPDNSFTDRQVERFGAVVAGLAAAGVPRPRYLHVANTGGAMAHPAAWFDLVRIGIGLYGIVPGPKLAGTADLRPAMTWRSRVAFAKRVAAGERLSYGLRYGLQRESWIATVPVGYADGYSRTLTGRGEVLIGGRRRPVAGSVTMDQLLVDCGDDPVREGDEVVLLGCQADQRISAEELAERIGTIPYEVVCAVRGRVPRAYVGAR
jgi:alanine racemase